MPENLFRDKSEKTDGKIAIFFYHEGDEVSKIKKTIYETKSHQDACERKGEDPFLVKIQKINGRDNFKGTKRKADSEYVKASKKRNTFGHSFSLKMSERGQYTASFKGDKILLLKFK